MRPTALSYSSHDRCEYIHREFIVQRALESWDNKTLLHLPMSQASINNQEWDFGNFRWYYDSYRQYGLDYSTFFFRHDLKKEDVDQLFHKLWSSQVVVLGGGNSSLGLKRYKDLGEKYYNERGMFERILHERQERGLLTVGFSAGADQICQYLSSSIDYNLEDPYGFGILKNVVTTLHHEDGREAEILRLATNLPHCLAFGLPNDSGVGGDQGVLPSGNIWQVLWFIEDQSWDVPQDNWHIKTRWGHKIVHFYADGRRWDFHGGDMLIRVMGADNSWQDCTILTNQGQFLDYMTQQPAGVGSIEEILSQF